jgi:hypothetical protein
MSALLPKADVVQRGGNVRFVPKADIPRCVKLPITCPIRQDLPLGCAFCGEWPTAVAPPASVPPHSITCWLPSPFALRPA